MKNPPPDLAQRLLDLSEQVLSADPPLRLEDVARQVGTSRAALYYYFSGRDDLIGFLLIAHAREGAEAVRAAVDPTTPPAERLRAMVGALAGYLGRRPGTCAGLLAALGASGRMGEVLQANDAWIAGPLRELLAEGHHAGAFAAAPDAAAGDAVAGEAAIADAANAVLGAVLLGVLGRAMSGADPADPRFRENLTEQAVRGVVRG